MVRNRIVAAGAMLATGAFVAALVASPLYAQSTSPSGSPSNGEPHPSASGPHTQAALFTQCPPIGLDTGCAILLTINQNGTVTEQTDASQPPFDGDEDTLIGVQNNANFPVTKFHLIGVATPDETFHFDNDGLCATTTPPGNPQPGCPFGSTGYEGPNTSFSNISADLISGDVNFTNGLFPATSDPCAPPTGISTFFSLEGALTPSDLNITPVAPPACATQTAAPVPTVVTAEPQFTG
jgi:hypothetical protein